MSVEIPAIGYLGIGLMGEPMVNRLLDAGYRVTVWNRTRAKMDGVLDKGAVAAESPLEVAEKSDLVFMCLMDAKAIEAVVFGEHGVAGSSNPDILCDFGTVHPDHCRGFAARLKDANGTTWVDAPVSGGVPGAVAGTLAIMAGGAKADVERLRPVVAHLSGRLSHMGANGAGLLTKLCNQIISACTISIVAEAVNFAEKSGVDAGRLMDALAGGFADSKPFQIFGPRMAARNFANPIGTTDSMIKDLVSVVDVANASGATIPMTDQSLSILRDAAQHGDGEEDISTIIRYFGRQNIAQSTVLTM